MKLMAIRATKESHNALTPLRTTKKTPLPTPKILGKGYNMGGGGLRSNPQTKKTWKP